MNIQVGWLCAYTPLELLIAAGLTPVRLFGSPGGSELADNLIGPNLCPYVRSCLEQGLKGDVPEAVVFAGCCDSMRRLFDAWSYYCRPSFTALIDIPRRNAPLSVEIFCNSLKKLVGGLEEYTEQQITANRLVQAIRARMEVDAILERTASSGNMKGVDVHRLFLEAQSTDPEFFAEKYADESTEPPRGGDDRHGKPITVTGNLLKSDRLINVIEECGGNVSVFDLCSVERFITWRAGRYPEIPDTDDRGVVLDYIAESYMSRTPCPRMLDRKNRLEAFISLVRSSGSVGVIYLPLMFCDPFLFELPELKAVTDESGIPGLILQSDYHDDNIGQLRTRIEAFMEML